MAQSRESTSSEQSRSGAANAGKSSGGSGAQNRDAASGGGSADQGADIVVQAQDQAMKLVDTAREQATSQLAFQQQRAAGVFNTVATALRDASREMRKQDETTIAEYVDTAATQVEHFANTLRQQDLEQLMSTTARFARSQPALFLGAAFTLGFAATRFLKSSSQSGGQTRSSDDELRYDRPAGNGASSYGSGYGYAGGASDLSYSQSSGSAGHKEDSAFAGSSAGMGSSGTRGSSASGTAGASSGSSGSSASGGSQGSGRSSGSDTKSGSGSASGSGSGSGGQSRSATGSGAENQ